MLAAPVEISNTPYFIMLTNMKNRWNSFANCAMDYGLNFSPCYNHTCPLGHCILESLAAYICKKYSDTLA